MGMENELKIAGVTFRKEDVKSYQARDNDTYYDVELQNGAIFSYKEQNGKHSRVFINGDGTIWAQDLNGAWVKGTQGNDNVTFWDSVGCNFNGNGGEDDHVAFMTTKDGSPNYNNSAKLTGTLNDINGTELKGNINYHQKRVKE